MASPITNSSKAAQAPKWYQTSATLSPSGSQGLVFWPLSLETGPVWSQDLASKQQQTPKQIVFALTANDGYNLPRPNESFSVKLCAPTDLQMLALANSKIEKVPWRCFLSPKSLPNKTPTIITMHSLSFLTFGTLRNLPVTASYKSRQPSRPAKPLAVSRQTLDLSRLRVVAQRAQQVHIPNPSIGLDESVSFSRMQAMVHPNQLLNRGWLRLWIETPPKWVLKVVALARGSLLRINLQREDLPKIHFALPGRSYLEPPMLDGFEVWVPRPTHAQQLSLARAIADVSGIVRRDKAGIIPWKCFLSKPKVASASIEDATFQEMTLRSSPCQIVGNANVVFADFTKHGNLVRLGPVFPEPEWVMEVYAKAWELATRNNRPNPHLGNLKFARRLEEGGSDLETTLSRPNATPTKSRFLITIPTERQAIPIVTALANNSDFRWEGCTLSQSSESTD